MLHGLVEDFVRPSAPKDSPLWWALTMFAVFFAITWAMLRGLEKSGACIRLRRCGGRRDAGSVCSSRIPPSRSDRCCVACCRPAVGESEDPDEGKADFRFVAITRDVAATHLVAVELNIGLRDAMKLRPEVATVN